MDEGALKTPSAKAARGFSPSRPFCVASDLGRVSVVGNGCGQRVDQAKLLVRTSEQQPAAIGTDRAAIECSGDLLLTGDWRREEQQRIVVGGRHAKPYPGGWLGVST